MVDLIAIVKYFKLRKTKYEEYLIIAGTTAKMFKPKIFLYISKYLDEKKNRAKQEQDDKMSL